VFTVHLNCKCSITLKYKWPFTLNLTKSQNRMEGVRTSSQYFCQNIAKIWFLPCDSYAKRGVCRRRVSVCVYVCVSITLRYCIKTAKRRITQIMPHDSPVTLVLWHQSSRRNSNGITPYGGDKCRWGGLKLVLSTKNAL